MEKEGRTGEGQSQRSSHLNLEIEKRCSKETVVTEGLKKLVGWLLSEPTQKELSSAPTIALSCRK